MRRIMALLAIVTVLLIGYGGLPAQAQEAEGGTTIQTEEDADSGKLGLAGLLGLLGLAGLKRRDRDDHVTRTRTDVNR